MPLGILYVIRPAEGGMKQHLLSLLTYLDRRNFRPVVVCPSSKIYADVFRETDTAVFPLQFRGELDFREDLRTVLEISRILRREKIDIIHAHGVKASLLAAAAQRFNLGTALVLTRHNSFKEENAWKKRFLWSALKMIGRRADLIIAVSNFLAREVKQIERIPAAKLRFIPNGIIFPHFSAERDNQEQALRLELGLPEKCPLVIAAGRLVQEKGFQILLEAAGLVRPRFPEAIFLLAGEGPEENNLKEKARSLALTQVKLLGHRRDIPRLLKNADLLVVPSLKEGFSIITLEGMAAGLPVVASRTGGLCDLVLPQKTGILVKPGDVRELSEAIVFMLSQPDAARKMGYWGQKRVEQQFSVERMVELTQKAYRELAESRLVLHA